MYGSSEKAALLFLLITSTLLPVLYEYFLQQQERKKTRNISAIEESLVSVAEMALQVRRQLDNQEMEGGGKRRKRRRRSHFRHERAEQAVYEDYFAPTPVFNDRQFERIYRVSKSIVQQLFDICARTDPFFTAQRDVSGRFNIGPLVKVLMALKLIGFGCSPSAIAFIHRTIFPATFDEYVSSLAPWETELLMHIEFSEDPFSVSDALSHGVRGVSDGSVWLKQTGAYGWAISTDIGERAVEGMGPAPGANPNSYRSEAYGMLAMLSFLKRLAEFTYKHEPWHGVIATDSLSLIDTILGVTRNEFGVANLDSLEVEPVQLPLAPLSPEWDLVVNIRRLLHELPGLKLKHVKGHQDRGVEYRRLSLLAQLNVDADALANRFQREHGAIRPYVTLTDDAGVHLVTPKGSITSNYKKAIRYQATYGPLLRYIQERNKWTPSITERINWQAHGHSLKKRMARRDHYVKLVHGILPTNHHLHRHDPNRRGCPICSHRDEDWAHITHPSVPTHNSRWVENPHVGFS